LQPPAACGTLGETNKAVIRPTSHGTLLDAREVLEEYPDVRLEVQGHTDDVGNDQFNLELSQARAEAVVQWIAGSTPPACALSAMARRSRSRTTTRTPVAPRTAAWSSR
jgi:outer membrane protein OmpA-like peptidoglycan-associated protein